MTLSLLDRDGFVVLPAIFTPAECEALITEWDTRSRGGAGVLQTESGHIYGAHNLLELWPGVASVGRQPPLPETFATVLGPDYGLVRVLFFDKPPAASWALPWHKDLTIAVRNNTLPSRHFTHPTRKTGLPHVEAPTWLLERMLTARVHLNEVTEENGPLQVLPGSHRTGKDLIAAEPRLILAERGDVLLMRPLLAHASGHAAPGTRRHRRILHLEFAALRNLPDGYAWHDFVAP